VGAWLTDASAYAPHPSEDDEFREWVSKRPRGYVFNTHRGYSDRENTRLHAASGSLVQGA
jgi:hypothetical protein